MMMTFAEFLLKKENASGIRGQHDAWVANTGKAGMYGADYATAMKELIDTPKDKGGYGGDRVAAMNDKNFSGKLWARVQGRSQGPYDDRVVDQPLKSGKPDKDDF